MENVKDGGTVFPYIPDSTQMRNSALSSALKKRLLVSCHLSLVSP